MILNGGSHPTPDEVDTTLDGTADAALEAHIRSCGECAALAERLREVRYLLATSAPIEPLPTDVAGRWAAALAGLPPYPGVDSDPTAIDANPPSFDLSVWSADEGVPPADPAVRTNVTRQTSESTSALNPTATAETAHAFGATHPDNGTARSSSGSGSGTSAGPGRRLRMMLALAAGAALVVGGGAAIFSALRPAATTSAAASATQADDESLSRGEPDGVTDTGAMPDAATPEAAAPAPPSASSESAPPFLADELRSADNRRADVERTVADGTLIWAGVPASDVTGRATACAAAVGFAGDVAGTEPSADGQVIIVDTGSEWAVLTVTPDCPDGESRLLGQTTVAK